MELVKAIGIDLGTSNSCVAEALFGGAVAGSKEVTRNEPEVKIFHIPQVVGINAVAEKKLLPSVVYLPPEQENSSSVGVLPWEEKVSASISPIDPPMIIGEYAKERGAFVPDRLCVSIKSWLCNNHVNRRDALLPWKSTSVPSKYSPFELSRKILKHLKEAILWNYIGQGENIALDELQVVLTVPASFDEVARTLTYEAAEEAGLCNVTLLEEPQAAFYAWLNHVGDNWRKLVSKGDVILVCDVGGGTADFSLIVVGEEQGNLVLERVSVGDHILLGGDNMDLALAFNLRTKLEAQGRTIDSWQFLSLIQGARNAKERLLADEGLEEISISIPSRGSSLLSSTISVQIDNSTVKKVVLDGFFPFCGKNDMPILRSSMGLQEFGLDYAADAALSKHLARFLTQSATNILSDHRLHELCAQQMQTTERPFILPNKMLFNGGIFKSQLIRQRLMEILQSWARRESEPQVVTAVSELPGADYDLAVAKGAAVYASLRKSGKGLRIRAGLSRSYYIGIETSMLAVPGYRPPIKGLCVAPQGTEEGSELTLLEQEFGLITGQPVNFRFFSSTVRAGDELGSVVENAETELHEVSGLSLELPSLEEQGAGIPIPVKLHAVVNEIGTLELWMLHSPSARKWKLEFNLRALEGE